MNTVTINYALKWRLKTDHKYQWSKCGKLSNIKTGRQKIKTVNGGSIGYWMGRKFISLNELRNNLEPIKNDCPF